MNISEYQNHPMRPLLDRILELGASQEFMEPDFRANETFTSALDSVLAIASTTQKLVDRTPPQLASLHGLNALQSSFQNIFNELSGYKNNKNPGHLQNARAQIEQSVMPQLWAFGPNVEQLELAPLSNLIGQLAKNTNEALLGLSAQRDAVSAKITVTEQRVADADARLENLSESVVRQRAEAASVVAVVQQAYAEKETERTAAFDQALRDLKAEFAQFQDDSKQTQQTALSALKASQDQAAQIVQVVGNIGVTGNYQNIANAEGTQANFWRAITVAFFCLGILIAGATFWKFWNQPFSPENAWSVLIRLMYALAITAPAWYTARESARHRSNADRARQTELELASLGPFIELMPDDKKHQIREELTKRYFGNQTEDHSIEAPLNIKAIQDLAVELIKAARK